MEKLQISRELLADAYNLLRYLVQFEQTPQKEQIQKLIGEFNTVLTGE